MKTITMDNLSGAVTEIDEGWQDWVDFGPSAVEFKTGRMVEINGVEKAVTHNAILSLLTLIQLGGYKGGVNQVGKYLYDNMNNADIVNSLNTLVHSPINKDKRFNARSHNDIMIGFDKPDRQYFRASDLITPFVGRVLEASAKFGATARPNHISISPTEGIRMSFILKEFESRENYGFGAQMFHPFVGRAKTTLSPIIKQGACDNTIRSAFDVGMFNTRGADTRFRMMTSTVGGMVEALQDDVVKFEGLREIEITQDDFNVILLQNRIRLNDEQHIAMLEGTRKDTTTAYGWINGLTYVAHKTEMPSSTRMELELFAGKLIATPEKYGLKANGN